MKSLIENLIIRFALILDKMGIAVCRRDTGMTCQPLSQFDAFDSVNGSNEEMTKIMRSNSDFRINASLGNAALYEVPHIAGSCLDNLFPRLFAVMDENRRSLGDCTDAEIFSHGVYGSLGNMDNGGLIAFPCDDGATLKQIQIVDMQTASLRDTKSAISQKQNIRSISEFFRGISYSGNIINGFLDSVHVWIDKVSGALQSKFLIDQIEEGRIHAATSASRVPVESVYCRSVQGLRSLGCVRSGKQEFYICVLCKWRIVANNISKLLQGAFVGLIGLSLTRRIHEAQKGAYGVI